MKKNERSVMLDHVPSGFYDSTLTAQGREGEHKRYPMDFYTDNLDKKSAMTVTESFPGNFYKTERS